MNWRMVISNKPGRRGEAFILHGDTFVLKVYRTNNTVEFAHFLVDLLNDVESEKLYQSNFKRETSDES